MAGNKSDLFDKEEVEENDARSYAEANGAVFKVTSAFMNSGIKDLFMEVGKKYMEKHFVDEGEETKKKKKTNTNVHLNAENSKEKNTNKCC